MATTATAAATAASHFFRTRTQNPKPKVGKIQARFGFGGFGGFGTKKSSPPPKKTAPKPVEDRLVWFPGANPPEWLDGTMVGDRGFDPFGLGKPAEYLQFELDSLDQNLAKNVAGDIIGVRVEPNEVKPTPFQPYSEVFGLQRFRECEVIHGRWAMLGTLGALAVEALTGVAWQDAGKVELVEGSSYLGQPLPFSLTTLIWIEVLVIGYIEFQRNAELDPEKRIYPGGYFDPLGLASDPEKKENLQLAEIKHSRLAMVAFLIFGIQAAFTGKGPIAFVATFNQ
ncbi:chlorophyll a-b binding protein CP29.3, chloroplastic [Ricinus communis]|uniref:Chlorophyll a-b binding protein, chloroplastic n=1 Tax=Ricinus communis TaxID=3988 RepID=B9SLN2_RICCO|nr:chlorophyll a-b binding protein CP29.3, chloroplastic [Ricinus communis]EEF35532.1 chlorophyll A/B binding protein, putative [Ricinus communis]|eukprot:XP_002526901.1 chlorophyll a-b binding protein CP29.3, chloroplastic [Ricinus communis]